MNVPAEQEGWGELGPAMRVLTERQQNFVRALVTEKPGYGSLVRAARRAGYTENKASTLSKAAHLMIHNPKIMAAIAEEAKKVVRGVGHAEAVAAIMDLVRNPNHRDHVRAVTMVMDRADPIVTRQSIDVTHRVVDADQEAIEELRALRELGTPRQKLLELYGGNGLARLERLEKADIERRSDKAKVIDGEVVEAEQP